MVHSNTVTVHNPHYALCSMLYALCSMLYALCSMLYALCSMLYALCMCRHMRACTGVCRSLQACEGGEGIVLVGEGVHVHVGISFCGWAWLCCAHAWAFITKLLLSWGFSAFNTVQRALFILSIFPVCSIEH